MVIAELWEVLYALEVARTVGVTHLILEMDSSSAISLIHHSCHSRHPYSSLILKIKHLIARNWIVRVEHIYQEAN